MRIFSAVFLLVFLSIQSVVSQSAHTVREAEAQTKYMLGEIAKAEAVWNDRNAGPAAPRSLSATGSLLLVPSDDWTSGFFSGSLWLLRELTGNAAWEKQARRFTSLIEREKTNGSDHDIGFRIYCSFGTGYRVIGDKAYRDVIVQAAKTLCTRFNPKVGCIQSWSGNGKWQYPVIIDNMMNLELLFAATRFTGDSTFWKIAVSHADTTMKNHFRSDYSSYHVVSYDPATGAAVKKNTAQGYSDASAWARGQAWGLYGYTVCYRETKDVRYLQQAEHIAAFILNNPAMPADLVPYWDYNAPGIPAEPRDASAAAITASALYELSTFSAKGSCYRSSADRIMKSLTEGYRSPVGANHGFLLLHSTGSKPGDSEVDVPLVYADYYYLEALLRAKNLRASAETASGKKKVSAKR
jgi:hypothetical protein